MQHNMDRLNCMNYHVYDNETEDFWFAQNGLRSLYAYSKNSNKTFRELCLEMIKTGEVEIIRTHDGESVQLTLTMI
jgi:hypothetical protein